MPSQTLASWVCDKQLAAAGGFSFADFWNCREHIDIFDIIIRIPSHTVSIVDDIGNTNMDDMIDATMIDVDLQLQHLTLSQIQRFY